MKDSMQPTKQYHLSFEDPRIAQVIIIDISRLCQHFCTINLGEGNKWQRNQSIGIH
jgi:hypothetical protein